MYHILKKFKHWIYEKYRKKSNWLEEKIKEQYKLMWKIDKDKLTKCLIDLKKWKFENNGSSNNGLIELGLKSSWGRLHGDSSRL
jgi:hypothetical protein